MWKELNIGSNRVVNASGVIRVMGQDQVKLELDDDGQLLLTMDLYDADRTHVGKLRRNAWAFHSLDFEITTNPSSLQLAHGDSGRLVAIAEVVDRDHLVVSHADFHAVNGERIIVTPDALRIGTRLTMAENTFVGTSSMLIIDEKGISIG